MSHGVAANAKRAAQAALLIVALVAVGAFVVQAVPQLVGAQHSYVVLSGSMTPAIHPGDSVLVGPVSPNQIRVGDVITYQEQADDPPITHRVISVQHTSNGGVTFKTKGDANQHADPWTVDSSQVIGEVRYTIPYIGYIVEFANTPTGLLTLVAVPFGLLVLTELGSHFLNSRSESAHRTSSEQSDESGEKETEGDDADDESVITLTTMDLRLTAIVLLAFAAYSGYMAYQYWTTFTIAATFTIVVVFALVTVGVFLGDDSESDADSKSDSDNEFEVATPVPAETPQTDGGDRSPIAGGDGEEG